MNLGRSIQDVAGYLHIGYFSVDEIMGMLFILWIAPQQAAPAVPQLEIRLEIRYFRKPFELSLKQKHLISAVTILPLADISRFGRCEQFENKLLHISAPRPPRLC